MRLVFLLLISILVILSLILKFTSKTGEVPDNTTLDTQTIIIGETAIQVEIIDTPETRTQGLSGRNSLEEGTGMLFVFESPQISSIWMKDMNFTIDIVWIDESGQIIGVERGVGPETFPQTFSPEKPIKYALELPSGFTEKHGIDSGLMMYLGQESE